MKRSTNRILTTHVGSLIRPQALQEFLRARQAGKPYDEKAYQKCLSDSVAEVVRQQADTGIDVPERRRIRQIDQLVAVRAGAPERLRAPADQAGGRQSIQARRGPDAVCRVLCRARRARGRCDDDRSDLHRPDQIHGHAELQRDIDNFKAALKREVEEPSCRSRRPRASFPTARTSITERRGAAGRNRGCDAHRIQDHHRRRLSGAARRCAQRGHL